MIFVISDDERVDDTRHRIVDIICEDLRGNTSEEVYLSTPNGFFREMEREDDK